MEDRDKQRLIKKTGLSYDELSFLKKGCKKRPTLPPAVGVSDDAPSTTCVRFRVPRCDVVPVPARA